MTGQGPATGNHAERTIADFGGPAFFLVHNSLVFRVTGPTKTAAASVPLRAETQYSRLPSKWLFASFLAQWVRRP